MIFYLYCFTDLHFIDGEFCPFDTFRAECSTDEVIMIEKAYYGAMRIGKCIEETISKCNVFVYIIYINSYSASHDN